MVISRMHPSHFGLDASYIECFDESRSFSLVRYVYFLFLMIDVKREKILVKEHFIFPMIFLLYL